MIPANTDQRRPLVDCVPFELAGWRDEAESARPAADDALNSAAYDRVDRRLMDTFPASDAVARF